jgi:hypothetical protein
MSGSAVLGDNLVDSLVTDVIDGLRRDLHPQFGVRPYRAWLVTRTWSGEIPGEGEGTPVDIEVELDPQPRVMAWGGYEIELDKCGLDEAGEIVLKEVSLTYTHAELTGGALAPNQEFFIKLTEAHGQGNPVRYFTHTRPPFVDREKDMAWILWLRKVEG